MNVININKMNDVTYLTEKIPVNVCLENGEATLSFKERHYESPIIEKGQMLFSGSGSYFILSLYHRYSDLLLLSISKSQLINFYINKSAKFQSFGVVDESFPWQFYHNGDIQRGYWWCDDDMVINVGRSRKILRGLFAVDVISEILTPEHIYQLFMRAAESLFELTFNHKPIERLCTI